MTRDLWPLPLGRCLKSQRRCSPQQAPEGPVTQDLCPWLLTPLPLNQLNHRPGVGGSLCTPAAPLFPTSLLLWHQVICLFSWTPCQAGTDDWLLHFSVQHKDLHIQALGLCPLNSFTHVVTHLQIFIACSMPDTVLGVKQLS